MRLSICTAIIVMLMLATVTSAQMGMMEGGMMGMQVEIIDIGPVWSPDDSSIVFSRVNASGQGGNWKPSSSGMGQMGMMGEGAGMYQGGMGMQGEGGMRGGRSMANFKLEGLMSAPVNGGKAERLVSGRTIVQDSANNIVAAFYQGRRQQGLFGINFGGGGKTSWYPAMLPWVRLSPDGNKFALPYKKKNAIVFFPAKANVQKNAGWTKAANTKRPTEWTADGKGMWILQKTEKKQQASGGMMMEGGGMGMGGMRTVQKYSIAIGTPDGVKKVIDDVGKKSFAVGIPNTNNVVAYIDSPGGSGGGSSRGIDRDGIYIYSRDGKQQRKLTSRQPNIMTASPNGELIAFTWGKKQPYSLSVAPVDGRPIRRLAYNVVGEVSGAPSFSWAHDNSKIAFAAAPENSPNGIFTVDIDTGKSQRISKGPKLKKPQPQQQGQQ